VLTDNGQHFTTPGNIASAAPLIREAMDRGEAFRAHSFELACAQNNIEHRLTKPYHPWTNGQVERMNRPLKEATVRRYHYGKPLTCSPLVIHLDGESVPCLPLMGR
jgi:transposase